ncbi:hypothetical protein HO173_004461 [Letharia columbiana]|uniref:Uncharacterized protein n=1 Tax=Letharia columbiana TaxID=112416 RepID=A0A8H6L6Q8_9LECA|nr:uncharacterized protein HO173_004461 [Letharia columbiana]KAF6237571.1 hypothetical protein HO173_004461 [Letharia columbiana]
MPAPKDFLLGMKKPRLYVALYALEGALRENTSSGAQDYYWAFIVAPKKGPKEQQCIRYRIKKSEAWEKLDPGKVEFERVEWDHDRCLVPLGRHDDIVARVLIAKIEEPERVEEHIQLAWPEQTMHVKNSGSARTSKDWVQRVLEGLGSPSLGLGEERYLMLGKLADWGKIESCCTSFAMKVVVERASLETVPTFDMLKNQEVFQ